MRQMERDVEQILKELGCTNIQRTQGKHMKWRFTTPGGNIGTTTTALSASDHRVMKNVRAVIRNEIRSKDGSQ